MTKKIILSDYLSGKEYIAEHHKNEKNFWIKYHFLIPSHIFSAAIDGSEINYRYAEHPLNYAKLQGKSIPEGITTENIFDLPRLYLFV